MELQPKMLGRLNPKTTCLLICDVQERFRDLIFNFGSVASAAGFLVGASRVLGMRALATEQYPERLGATVAEVGLGGEAGAGVPVLPKKKFSMLTPEVEAKLEEMQAEEDQEQLESFIIVGLETHVCVQQTCLDLLAKGYNVHLAVDGISSMRAFDRSVALERMRAAGAFTSTAESLVFELLGSADHPQFKQCSGLVKARTGHWPAV